MSARNNAADLVREISNFLPKKHNLAITLIGINRGGDYFPTRLIMSVFCLCGDEEITMTDKDNRQDILRQLGSGEGSFPQQIQPRRDEMTHELQKHLHILGPTPKRCLEMFADLGVSDPEIARYFKIPTNVVTDLRRVWGIDGET